MMSSAAWGGWRPDRAVRGDGAPMVERIGRAPPLTFLNLQIIEPVTPACDQPSPFAPNFPTRACDRGAAGAGHVTREAGGGSALSFEAAIFDMDGVVTQTAAVHSAAWKRMFDEYLRLRAARAGELFREFNHATDYLAYVDGRPRYQGVEAFLRSRGISLPSGSPEDLPGTETVCGLGNRKNALFNEILEREGVRLFDSTVALIHEMRRRGIKVGLATSSKNSAVILRKTGTAPLFGTVIDGVVSAKLGLRGKPEPDIFTTAAGCLEVPGARAIVVEDAVSGVQAGAKGGFALVIGVARENNARELRAHGADLVVADLGDTSIDEIDRLVRARRAGAAPFAS